jgi:hypothetical protein
MDSGNGRFRAPWKGSAGIYRVRAEIIFIFNQSAALWRNCIIKERQAG